MLTLCSVLLLAGPSRGGTAAGIAYSVELEGTIDPATQSWLRRALEDAAQRRARLAIIRLDTPGGLDTSMRAMVQDILAARMPVVVYVSPDGARAASAGLFITQSADAAAMAPRTNIGSATPISLGGGEQDEVLGRKVRNDAAAYVRALAAEHGRNPALAERMVREATNVSARHALREGLIDVVALDEARLLRQLDGFRLQGPRGGVLRTAGLTVERHDTPLRYEILQLLVNPNVAFLLLVLGLVAIALEVVSPGLGGPGIFGAVALVLGLYGTAQLPVAAAGVILLVLAVGLLIAETQVASGGLLGAGGIAALVVSGLLLFDTDSEALAVSVPVAVTTGTLLGSFTLFAASRALAARRAPPHPSGAEGLVGRVGAVRVALDPVGQVFVDGALWRATAAEGAAVPKLGDLVVVESVAGLTLHVRAMAEDDPPSTRRAP